jgi:murein L,D-transpeptidase YcbB/YkuD
MWDGVKRSVRDSEVAAATRCTGAPVRPARFCVPVMGPQTAAAIQDLQRQAGLPQTGTMNPATQTALANYLAHGNNQMAG